MKHYEFWFINGFNLVFRSWSTRAASLEEARGLFWHTWGSNFEHAITGITEDGVLVYER